MPWPAPSYTLHVLNVPLIDPATAPVPMAAQAGLIRLRASGQGWLSSPGVTAGWLRGARGRVLYPLSDPARERTPECSTPADWDAAIVKIILGGAPTQQAKASAAATPSISTDLAH